MPAVVKQCYNSLCNHSNGYKIIFIDQNNLNEYVCLPASVVKLNSDGIISNALFSDIIRSSLLMKYGGLWIDATYWILNDINLIGKRIFTLRQEDESSTHVSNSRWAFNCIGSGSPYYIWNFINECLIEYVLHHKEVIDYFLIDYVVRIAYNNFIDFRELIDSIPYSCPDILKMQEIFFEEYDEDYFSLLKSRNTMLKLSWKLFLDNKKSETTFYDYFINL